MKQAQVIKAMEDHAGTHKLKLTTIGQLAVGNRYAYDRLVKGTAHIDTARRIAEWIKADRAARRKKAKAA